MNIHFESKDQFLSLLESTIYKVEIGSKLYGLQDENSDKDILCVFVPNEQMLNSGIYKQSNSQFQYKDKKENIDYIFTDVYTFIQNLLSGDSSINFEAINDKSICDTILDFLYGMRKEFYTYKVTKGYLGKIKKDLDNMYKYGKDNRGYNKKLIHAFRGLISVQHILDGNYINQLDEPNLEMCKYFKSFTLNKQREPFVKSIRENTQITRDKLNKLLEDKNINFYLDIEVQAKLDEKLFRISQSNWFNTKKVRIFDMNLIYNAMENGIKY